MRAGALLFISMIVLTGAAVAQESRYQLERTADGYVRLDTETGTMSLCREQGDQLICQMATEDREALEDRIDALSDRIAALETRTGATTDGQRSDLPSDEELERSMGIMETFMRRFFAIVEDLNRDFNEETPAEPAPDRT